MLVHLARTQVHFEGAEARPAGSGSGFHTRLSRVPVVYHNCLGNEGVYAGGPCNSLEFKELHDQNKNTYGPYSHHCAASHFAPMSAYSGKSPIEGRADVVVIQRIRKRRLICDEE